jgi:hypothetical protein
LSFLGSTNSTVNIDRCLFCNCSAAAAGVMYVEFVYLIINKTRFENNSGTGADIMVTPSTYDQGFFSLNNLYDVCSTSLRQWGRIAFTDFISFFLIKDCSDDYVCFFLIFIFLFDDI